MAEVTDLGYTGELFTLRWGRIRERLDHMVGNQGAMSMFPLISIVHKEFDKSDHRPVLLDTKH